MPLTADAYTALRCYTDRQYGHERNGLYLVSISTGCDFRRTGDQFGNLPDPTPQARAVMDDFGNLVFVTGWW